MSLKQEIKNKYNSLAPKYDKLESIIEFLFINKLRKEIVSQAKGNILETGVGTGKNLHFYPKNSKITATDLSEKMLKIAKKRSKNLYLKFKEADTESLPFKTNSFDTVVNSLSLCTYPDPLKAIKEMKRVCKPEGKILFLEHGISNNRFLAFLQNKYKNKHFKEFCCNLTRNPLELIEKSNLKIIYSKRKILSIFYIIIAEPNK